MAFAAARMILKDKRRKSKEDFVPPQRTRSKVFSIIAYNFYVAAIESNRKTKKKKYRTQIYYIFIYNLHTTTNENNHHDNHTT